VVARHLVERWADEGDNTDDLGAEADPGDATVVTQHGAAEVPVEDPGSERSLLADDKDVLTHRPAGGIDVDLRASRPATDQRELVTEPDHAGTVSDHSHPSGALWWRDTGRRDERQRLLVCRRTVRTHVRTIAVWSPGNQGSSLVSTYGRKAGPNGRSRVVRAVTHSLKRSMPTW